MKCKELIEVMATKGYWISPGGRTPEASRNELLPMTPDFAGPAAS